MTQPLFELMDSTCTCTLLNIRTCLIDKITSLYVEYIEQLCKKNYLKVKYCVSCVVKYKYYSSINHVDKVIQRIHNTCMI